MGRQSTLHHGLRGRAKQFDLFAQPGDVGAAQVPQWQALPVETRQTLTKLMVRLILAQVDGDRAEMHHDV